MANIYELDLGTLLELEGQSYTITGVLELEQLGYRWKEYNLKNEQNEVFWLSVEKWAGPDRYMLTWPLKEDFVPTYTLRYNELTYKVFDAGFATVVGAVGDEDAQLGEQVFFKEYLYNMPKNGVETEADILLTYESWGGEEAFSGGRYLFENQIVAQGLDFKPVGDTEKFLDLSQSLKNLSLGSFMTVQGDSYYIAAIVKNKQKNYIWWEYELKREEGGKGKWLTVEPYDQLNLELSSSISYGQVKYSTNKEVAHFGGRDYQLLEKGRGHVESFTHGDYDHKEPFGFMEYIHPETGEKLSIESWEDENEASIGTPLSADDVIIDYTKEKKKVSSDFGGAFSPSDWIVPALIAGFIVVFAIISLSLLGEGPTIQSQLDSSGSFLRLTYVTLNDKSDAKAFVYAYTGISPYVDSVTKQIISMDPEKVKQVYSSTEGAADTLVITSREQALIYEGEDGRILVQISKVDKQPEIGITPYMAKHGERTTNFYRTSGSRYWRRSYFGGATTVNDSDYTSYTTSARNSSIASRQSSGGGTGFGK